MKSLSEVILSSVALLEAEGRMMRAKAIATGSAVISIFIGGLFMFVGCLVAALAAYVFLKDIYGQMIAALTVAALFMLVGLILLFYGNSKR